jgi:hypothetical protein
VTALIPAPSQNQQIYALVYYVRRLDLLAVDVMHACIRQFWTNLRSREQRRVKDLVVELTHPRSLHRKPCTQCAGGKPQCDRLRQIVYNMEGPSRF